MTFDEQSFQAFAEEFVRAYNNEPGNDVTRFYAQELEWLEMPSGRHGRRAELFAAFAGVREFCTDLEITEIVQASGSGNVGVLECRWCATRVPDAPGGAPIPIDMFLIWIWTFDEQGLITRQHDYSILIADEPMPYL
jgi:SnoaL-like domain